MMSETPVYNIFPAWILNQLRNTRKTMGPNITFVGDNGLKEGDLYLWTRGEKPPPATDHTWSRQLIPWLPRTAWARAIQLLALCWWGCYERKGCVCVCVCARAHMCTYMCIYTCSESHASPYLQRQQSGRAHLTSMCGEEGEGEEKSMSWRTPSPWEKDLDRRRHKRKGDVHQRRKRKNWVYKNPLRVPCTVLRGQKPTFRRSDEDGKGNPHQYSCLENPMNWGAWWATVHRVAQSQTWLSN